jgi:fructose-bisphosphate aldolase, class I
MVYDKKIEKKIKKLQTNKKSLFLAYDHGLEHGPDDLPNESINPEYLIKIAENSEIDGFICHKGIAEKYCKNFKKKLILKINGKTLLGPKKDPYSPIICSVRYAYELGAYAIGFTNFDGSEFQTKIIEDFQKIQEESREYGLPIISWMYPRGVAIQNDLDKYNLSYSARIGLELGSDFIKMKFNGNIDDLKYMKKACGKAKLLLAGGKKEKSTRKILEMIYKTKDLCDGYAFGRNIFKHEKPIELIKAIRDIQIRNKNVDEALKRLENYN